MNIAVAYGRNWLPGRPPRPEDMSEVSVLDSVRDATQALKGRGHEVRVAVLVRDLIPFISRLRHMRAEAVVNLVEGAHGSSRYEPHAVAAMDLAGFAWTGNPFEALALCRDKPRVRAVLAGSGIPIPPGGVTGDTALPDVPLPAIVKPAREDGSIGMDSRSVVRSKQALSDAIRRLLDAGWGPALVERYVAGRELNVSMIGGAGLSGGEEPERVLVGEVLFRGLPPRAPRIVTYDAKWVEGSADYRGTPTRVPADLSDEVRARVERIARATWTALGLSGYARVDLRMDRAGQPYVIDVNPNPDIGPGSGFRKALAALGITFGEFLEDQVDRAMRRRAATAEVR